MESPDGIIKQSLQSIHKMEKDRAAEAAVTGKKLRKLQVKPVENDDYLTEISVLPPNFMDGLLLDNYLDEDFMDYLCHGLKACVAVLPYAENCSNKEALEAGGRWGKFLNEKGYFYVMRVTSNGLCQRYRMDNPGYYYDPLPEILRKDVREGGCTFEINYPFPPRPGLVQSEIDQNRQWLESMISRACNNLRNFSRSFKGTGPAAKPD